MRWTSNFLGISPIYRPTPMTVASDRRIPCTSCDPARFAVCCLRTVVSLLYAPFVVSAMFLRPSRRFTVRRTRVMSVVEEVLRSSTVSRLIFAPSYHRPSANLQPSIDDGPSEFVFKSPWKCRVTRPTRCRPHFAVEGCTRCVFGFCGSVFARTMCAAAVNGSYITVRFCQTEVTIVLGDQNIIRHG